MPITIYSPTLIARDHVPLLAAIVPRCVARAAHYPGSNSPRYLDRCGKSVVANDGRCVTFGSWHPTVGTPVIVWI